MSPRKYCAGRLAVEPARRCTDSSRRCGGASTQIRQRVRDPPPRAPPQSHQWQGGVASSEGAPPVAARVSYGPESGDHHTLGAHCWAGPVETYRDQPRTETRSTSIHKPWPVVTSGQEVGQTRQPSRVCHAGIGSDAGPQESGRVLIVFVEQVVDTGKRLQVRVDLVVCRDIDDREAGRVQAPSEAVATDVDPLANMHK